VAKKHFAVLSVDRRKFWQKRKWRKLSITQKRALLTQVTMTISSSWDCKCPNNNMVYYEIVAKVKDADNFIRRLLPM
jgi:hypothetical protein